MKRSKIIFNRVQLISRIEEIILEAAKGKKKRPEVRKVLNNIDYYSCRIHDMLQSGRYELYPVKTTTIFDGRKERDITISPFFPNRILDHVLVDIFKPEILKGMYQYCVGNVDGKGILYGKHYTEKQVRRYQYYVKLDIRKFYPSVSAANMYAFLEHKTKDKKALQLARAVLSQSDSLPIGSYYSQWFSNFYLEDLDHYIKEGCHAKGYIRYVDDMVIFGDAVDELRNICEHVIVYAKEIKHLEIKDDYQIHRIDSVPLNFLGFKFQREKTNLRSNIFVKLNKTVRQFHHKKTLLKASRITSYLSWLINTTFGYLYYNRHIKPIIRKGFLRRFLSKFQGGKRCRHLTYQHST